MRDLPIREFDGEPRMRDLDIAEALGFERVHEVRRLIERNRDDIENFGVFVTMTKTPAGGGRPGAEYWLNEQQALFLCTRSEAPHAVAMTRQMVLVFAAWRNGQLPALDPGPGHNGPPGLPADADIWRGLIREARLLFGRDRARWLWGQSPLPQMPSYLPPAGEPETDRTAIVLRFLRECCEVTGDKADFVTSREVITAFDAWAARNGHVLGERALSLTLQAISAGYRDPDTGRTFARHKRDVTGYRGLVVVETVDDAVLDP